MFENRYGLRFISSKILIKMIESIPTTLRKNLFSGGAHYCPVCNHHITKFLTYGAQPRPNAWCPVCGSLERHRFVWIILEQHTNLFDKSPKKMLHVAPEKEFESRLNKIPNLFYVSIDLLRDRAKIRMDVSEIGIQNELFDVIYCSHVLEHVYNDTRALNEFYRVLKPNGWAIIIVPMGSGRTIEDPSIIDPKIRTRMFGQRDHVRIYGLDFQERLKNARFNISVMKVDEIIIPGDNYKLGIPINLENIYYCTKQ